MGFHYKNFLDSRYTPSGKFDLSGLDISFFLVQATSVWFFSSSVKYNINTVFVEKAFWTKFMLLAKSNFPNKLPYIVDGAQFSGDVSGWVVQFNLNNMLSDGRLHTFTHLPVGQHYLTTTSTLFRSSVWLERELSDFTNIQFTGLTDTRRLLLDYFEEKQAWQTHIANDKNFNDVLYDISLNY